MVTKEGEFNMILLKLVVPTVTVVTSRSTLNKVTKLRQKKVTSIQSITQKICLMMSIRG